MLVLCDISEVSLQPRLAQGVSDFIFIPRDVEHSFEVLEPGEVPDFFSPPRKDYL